MIEAASCTEVKTALGSKVSRERIGHEVNIHFHWYAGFTQVEGQVTNLILDRLFTLLQIDLMLRGKKPVTAMRFVEQLQLFSVIFTNGISNTKPPLEETIGR